MRISKVFPFSRPRAPRVPRLPRVARQVMLGASVGLTAVVGCANILGIEDVTERKGNGGSTATSTSSASGAGGHGGMSGSSTGAAGMSTTSSTGATTSSTGSSTSTTTSTTSTTSSTGGTGGTAPVCDPATRWPVVVADPIVPPSKMMGLDLNGADDAGITIQEAIAVNCVGVDAGGVSPGGGGMSWGAQSSASLYYDIASGRWEQMYLTAGYTGSLTWQSADAKHTYVMQIGAPLTKDGVTFVIDWFPNAAMGTTQATLDAEITELYNGLVATFAPGTPPAVNCRTEKSCGVFPNAGGGNSTFTVRPGIRMGYQFSNPAMGQASTPNLIYEFAPVTWNDFTQAAEWASFDTTKVDPNAKGFVGVESNGQYLYLVPNAPGSLVTRYDTSQPGAFSSAGPAWETFDTTTLDANAKGYSGGSYDFRYVYFAPGQNGLALQYDSAAPLGIASSWATFDTTTLTPPASSFAGAIYSANYGPLLYVPGASGVAAMFLTGNVFSTNPPASPSWQSFDLTTIDARLTHFHGGVTAGQYYYLAPHGAGSTYPGIVARWDGSTYDITNPTSWTTFDLNTVDPVFNGLLAFDDAVYDGARYVYFVPAATGSPFGNDVMQYDTTLPFNATSSWQFINLTAFAGGSGTFTTGGWDGRFVYFSGPSSTIVRYDSTAPFTTQSSWNWFDVSAGGVDPSANVAFQGSAFDGRYMYFVPDTYSTLLRLDAKFPPGAINPNFASFY